MSDENKLGSRKSLIDPPTPREARSAVKDLSERVESLVLYKPTTGQRKAKARLMIALEDNPVVSLDSLTAEQATQLSKYDCSKFWSTPGFKAWLTGTNEFRERVEYLAYLSLDAAEEILLSDDPRMAGAKVSTIAKVTELAAKLPNKRGGDKYADEFIQNMNRRELEQFLKKNTDQLPASTEVEYEDLDGQD
jgi:hypothetical protein